MQILLLPISFQDLNIGLCMLIPDYNNSVNDFKTVDKCKIVISNTKNV